MNKELYPYQIKCHEAIISNYDRDVINQLIVLFTGAGKTFILIKLLERMGFKRVLWLSFQEELVSQSAMAFIADKFDDSFYNYVNEIGFLNYVKDSDSRFSLKGFSLGCIKGDIFKPDANVVMGSVMTVAKRLDRIAPDFYDCVICDEAHLFGSKSAYSVISHFKPKLLLGCTATPTRVDGVMMGDIFDEISFNYGLHEGIKDGYCTELDAIRITTNVSLDNVKTTAGDFNQGDLSHQVDTLARNQLIVDKWKEHANGRQTIAFCVNIQHAINLAEAFQMNGINAVAVSSNEELTPDRSENITKFKEGKIQIITNVGILVAGFDHKDTGCAIMAAPTKSLTRYLQSIGRAARLKTKGFVEKFGQNAIIIDVIDVTNKHSLINCWELDKKKAIEDRTFTTQEKKDKLLADRLAKKSILEHTRDKDERIKLLSLPPAKQFGWKKMQEAATSAQLKYISDLGHDIQNNTYTKQQCADIISLEPCNKKEIEYLKSKGYDTTFATKGQYGTIYYELEMKNKWKKK
jgi:superfamily II DNA or RNA helicase